MEVTPCVAEDIPEADLVMGFQNYAQLPKSMGGLLGVDLPTDPFAPLGDQRVQVQGLSESRRYWM